MTHTNCPENAMVYCECCTQNYYENVLETTRVYSKMDNKDTINNCVLQKHNVTTTEKGEEEDDEHDNIQRYHRRLHYQPNQNDFVLSSSTSPSSSSSLEHQQQFEPVEVKELNLTNYYGDLDSDFGSESGSYSSYCVQQCRENDNGCLNPRLGEGQSSSTCRVQSSRSQIQKLRRPSSGSSSSSCRGGLSGISNGFYYRMFLATLIAVSVLIPTASASCTKGVTELWAYPNAGFEEFHDSYTKYITSTRGSVCKWVVVSSKEGWNVKLEFDPFKLKNTKGGTSGDCLDIFDGGDADAPVLAKLCDEKSAGVYRSKGRKLFVVYTRGKVEGHRKIGFHYKAIDDNSNEDLIRIAGIIGGTIAGVAVIYLTIRYTECCGCLRKKGGNDDDNDADNPRTNQHGRRNHGNQERDRLTVQVMEDGVGGGGVGEGSGAGARFTTPGNRPPLLTTTTATGTVTTVAETDIPNSTTAAAANSSNNIGSNGSNYSSSSNSSNGGGLAAAGESDSDSVHNEPPPSYESLYLNENGETAEPPPEYTPPRHRAKNPPRRVHTFN